MGCLDEETVVLAALGRLDASDQAEVDAHLDACAACRRLLVAFAQLDDDPVGASAAATVADLRTATPEPALGARIDRYVLGPRLGAGAMGVVHAAHDPDLDRPVAVKILREAVGAGDERWLREGRAVARLTHPNVIGVHDVGVAAGRGYIVMELIEGASLQDWLAAAPRAPAEILTVLVAAGRGLAAAHAAGLVHRDFKPANALVGRDGRVKVGDFGLARAPDSSGGGLAGLATGSATRTGALVGTPAYMAPEQLDGAAATAASDQFAFAVSTWEGLTGARPFAGTTVAALRSAIAAGPPPPPRAMAAPVARALRRALAEAPAARFASLEDLLAALAPRRRRGSALGVALAGVALAATTAVVLGRGGAAPSCASAGVGGAWDRDRQAAVARAFGAIDRPDARDALRAVQTSLDRYAQQWADADTARCATATAAAPRTATCLDELRGELDGFTTLLATADPALVDRAPLAAAALVPPRRCAELAAHGDRAPADLALRGEVEVQATRLARARALALAGRYAEAAELGRAIGAAAIALGYRPLVADAALVVGTAELALGDGAAAEAALVDAARAAEAVRDDLTAADARIMRLAAVAIGKAELARAAELVGDAQAALDRLGGDVPRLATLLARRGAIATLEGHPAIAVADQAVALGLRRAVLAPDADEITTTLIDLGRALDEAGQAEVARALDDDALARRERALGPHHPALADVLTNRGVALAEAGDFAASDRDWRRALALRQAALPADHPQIAALLVDLGANARDQRRYDDALALFDQARAMFARRGLTADAARRGFDIARVYFEEDRCAEAAQVLAPAEAALATALGPDHPDLATLIGLDAQIDTCLGKTAAALIALARVRAIDERALGPDHPQIASDYELVAEVYTHANDDAHAIEAYREALRRKERAYGPDHLNLANTLDNMGDSLIELGRCGEGAPIFQRALAIEERAYGPTSARLAYALRGLGRCQRATGDRAAARASYARAVGLDDFAGLGRLTEVIRAEQRALGAPRT
jgi:tetratricopeptide (TPR) repeat protein